jgi:hypothetical protein
LKDEEGSEGDATMRSIDKSRESNRKTIQEMKNL